ncbi:MAG: hypothetical protein R3F59_19815 [Myxococcota bacterium]
MLASALALAALPAAAQPVAAVQWADERLHADAEHLVASPSGTHLLAWGPDGARVLAGPAEEQGHVEAEG